MPKHIRSLGAFLLCIVLLCTFPFAAFAAELRIASAEELIAFSENCRLDGYSKGLTVLLENDLDLSNTDFTAIPTFGGTFEGNGHRIYGLHLQTTGSQQGLFRYLQRSAVVRNLTVEGTLSPDGSRSAVGGIAGSNAGLIENCRFSGQVTGAGQIGGLVGINEVSGVVSGCQAEGTIHGSHFVGGMVGENRGVIRDCTNSAAINTTVSQNDVDISDITLESLTDSESVSTVTDIGGITGSNSGVLRNCQNNGTVGYRRIGYNIGGIAGSQIGYIQNCTNHGAVYGRKEVGGIVGQMEPVLRLDYDTDTLQTLQEQLNAMDQLAESAVTNSKNNASDWVDQATDLQNQINQARDAAEQLLPNKEQPYLPDSDQIAAAQNSLNSSITAIPKILSAMNTAGETATNTLRQDLQAISDQMNAISNTLGNASEGSGGSIKDISDQDTAEDTTGKVENCVNLGAVQGDWNVGGITGSIAIENDLDPEEDLQISGNTSLNFDLDIRSVILNSKNSGTVTARKQNAGGITGWMSLGLVRNCFNATAITGTDYVGGIAGLSDGAIRQCHAKSVLSGETYVGGIAGRGTTVTDCRSMAEFQNDTERSGGILGYAELPAANVQNNVFLPVYTDIGGIDGISYMGSAEPLTREGFYALENLPSEFYSANIQFRSEEKTVKTVTLSIGETLPAAEIPTIPQKDGSIGRWEAVHKIALTDPIYFDLTFNMVYTPLNVTIQSDVMREHNKPVLLVQGTFTTGQTVPLQEQTTTPVLTKKETLIEAWSFTFPEGTATQLRYAPPTGYSTNKLQVMLCDAEGNWRETSFQQSDSYLVFDIQEGDQALLLKEVSKINGWFVLLVSFFLLGVCLLIILLLKRKKNKK
ncbi:MAG: FIVAR domain-containing protein [Clostridia bacterium]|nr:FIVAR domain-containing protein [Clostridia bacterium]